MSIYSSEGTDRYYRLREQAKDKVLLVSPPYNDYRVRDAFISGYETCLRDISNGNLDVSEVKD